MIGLRSVQNHNFHIIRPASPARREPIDKRTRRQVVELFWNRALSCRAIARLCNISHTTVSRIVEATKPPAKILAQLKRFKDEDHEQKPLKKAA